MICPHCGKDTNDLTWRQVSSVIDTAKIKYGDEIKSLIGRFIMLLPNMDRKNIINFLSRIEPYDAEAIHFGINYFLATEHHLKGKSWEYCAAIIARRYK